MRRAILCGFVLGLLALPLFAEISFADERQIALWILRRGGQVMVDGVENPIGDPFDLPDRDFRIVMVDMHGTVIEPKQLQEISKLEHVRELYVPARVWSPVSDVKAPFSDESFQYYQGMKRLETFSAGLTTLAWLDIGDEGVKRLAPLSQLKHLRLNNTTIKDPKCFEALVNLESLDLGDAYVLDYSLAPLANMKNLKRLNLLGTLVTDDGLKYLRDLTEDGGSGPLWRQGHRRRRGASTEDDRASPAEPARRPDHGCERGDSRAVQRTARPEPLPQQDH